MYKNTSEWVEDTLKNKVLLLNKETKHVAYGQKISDRAKKLTLENFAPRGNDEIIKFWVEMLIDVIEREFGVRNLAKKSKLGEPLQVMTIGKMIEWLTKQKELHAKYGNAPFKKKGRR